MERMARTSAYPDAMVHKTWEMIVNAIDRKG